MKSLVHKGRISLACLWRSPGRTLLQLVIPLLNLSCISAPAFSFSPEAQEPQQEEFLLDLVHNEPIDRLELLIYRADEVQQLVLRKQISHPGKRVSLPCQDSDYIIIGIANLPAPLKDEAIERLSALETLSVPFSADRPGFPIMSGSTTSRTLSLRPLRSTVVLRSISNPTDGYALMECPRVRLINISQSAELLRWSGFRSAEITKGEWQSLPCDVGYFTQYPGIILHCFPSDDESSGEGTRHPILELEYTMGGDSLRCQLPIGPIRRAETVYLDL